MHRVCFLSFTLLTIRWGRVTLLEALSKYRSTDVKDAEHVCERVVPQFQHQNASVVMAAVKVIMLNLNNVGPEMQKSLIKKMGPPLGIIPPVSLLISVTMISSAPEVQYVALRNISLILQKQPDILSKEWRIFVPPPTVSKPNNIVLSFQRSRLPQTRKIRHHG